MQAVSLGWSYPSAAGIAPVFMDETGAGALSRPARPEAWANGARDSQFGRGHFVTSQGLHRSVLCGVELSPMAARAWPSPG